MEKVYIILVNWNGYKDTIDCIKSILKNYYTDYSIVIVDNKSSNESVRKIKEWFYKSNLKIKELTNYDIEDDVKGIKVDNDKFFIIKNNENSGFANANNLGMKLAMKDKDCKYMWILNNDTIIEKESLFNMVNLFKSDKLVGMVGSKLLYYYNKNIIQEIYGEVLWNDNGKGIGNGEVDFGQWDKNMEVNGRIMGASMLVSVDSIKKIGLMSEEYFMEYEETDWCTRFLREGYKIMYCYNSRIWHKEGGTIKKDNKIKKKKVLWKEFDVEPPLKFLIHNYYSFRNNIFFTKKFFKKDLIKYNLFVLPKKTIYYFIKASINSKYRKEYIKLIFRAIKDGYTMNMGKTIDPVEWQNNLRK